jgi:hypothetical protein
MKRTKIMANHQGSNTFFAQDARAKALSRAQDTMKARGIVYPTYDPKLPVEENYERLEAYAIQESSLVHQFLNEQPNPRPLVDNAKPIQQYRTSYRDD